MQIPLFPLGTVLFPGGVLPLRIFETRYVDMTRDCVKTKRPFGVCLIREGPEVGGPAVPESVGCLALIDQWDVPQLGLIHLRAIGDRRFRVRSTTTNGQGLVVAEADILEETADAPVPEEFASFVELVRRVIEGTGPEAFSQPHRFDSASWVAFRLAEMLGLPMPLRQRLLEQEDPIERLAFLRELLAQDARPPS